MNLNIAISTNHENIQKIFKKLLTMLDYPCFTNSNNTERWIGEDWGTYRDIISCLKLSEGITYIGTNAFRRLKNIKHELDLPDYAIFQIIGMKYGYSTQYIRELIEGIKRQRKEI